MVTAFAFALAVGGLVRVLLFANAAQRRFHRRIAARAVISAALMLTFASSLWLMLTPAADQPLLAAFETATGLAPSKFLTSGEQEVYESAARDMLRFQAEVDRLNAMEKTARHQGAPLADDEIRRIASYQQAFSEMTRGERFVQDVLRAKARAKERWIVGLPAAMIALLGLAFLTQPWWRTLHLKRQKIRMNC